MNLLTAWILVISATLFGLIPWLLTARFRKNVKALSEVLYPCSSPNVAMLLPCKGIDPGFRENLRAFFNQDYPSFSLVFSVATSDDPACGEIDALIDEYAGRVNAHRIVAGIKNVRAQKITNLLSAVEFVGSKTDIFVFVDSDLRPDPGFVRRLIAPLSLPQVGVTTGYRWYEPLSNGLGSVLRSAWNAGGLPFLSDEKRNFCYGGAMAMRRETFEKANMRDVWDRALSDDLSLTVKTRELGMKIVFVPSCVTVTHEDSTLAQTIEFTNRQSLISKVYYPRLWWGAAIGHSIGCLFALLGFYCLIAWIATGGKELLLGIGCLIILPLQWINALWLMKIVREILPQIAGSLTRLRWRYLFASTIAPFLSFLNMVNALSTNRITWRGVCYEMRSPRETLVVENKKGML